MGAYTERYAVENAKRDAIETALKLFGWKVMYKSLRDKGIEVLRFGDGDYAGKVMCSLRPDHRPTIPGWKIAAYDALFSDE
jgi:hypothetical protein